MAYRELSDEKNRIAYLEERIERRYAMLGALKIGTEDYERNVLAVLAEDKVRRRSPQDGVARDQ